MAKKQEKKTYDLKALAAQSKPLMHDVAPEDDTPKDETPEGGAPEGPPKEGAGTVAAANATHAGGRTGVL